MSNETWCKQLLDKHPNVFKQELPHGIECKYGWSGILGWLCDQLNKERLPENFSLVQVKNKFGLLTIYADGATTECLEWIDIAEYASSFTCELCGSTINTKLRKDGWMQVRCDLCQQKVGIGR